MKDFKIKAKSEVESTPEIKFGFRGEGIEYKIDDKILTIDSTWVNGRRLYTDTIIEWDNGDKLNESEKANIFQKVIEYINVIEKRMPIVVINKDFEFEFWRSLTRKLKSKISKIEMTSIIEQEQFEYNMLLEIMKKGLTINGKKIESQAELDQYWKSRKSK